MGHPCGYIDYGTVGVCGFLIKGKKLRECVLDVHELLLAHVEVGWTSRHPNNIFRVV